MIVGTQMSTRSKLKLMNLLNFLLCYISIAALISFRSGTEAIVQGNSIAGKTYLGSLHLKYPKSKRHRCTTSLVSWQHVVTSARCLIYQVRMPYIVEKLDFTELYGEIIMGNHRLTSIDTIRRPCRKVSLHPKYERFYGFKTGAFDLGIITLKDPFPFSYVMSFLPYVKPLDADGRIENLINNGTLKCYIYAYGSDQLYMRVGEYCVEACFVSSDTKGTLRSQDVLVIPSNSEKCCDAFIGYQSKMYCKSVVNVTNGLRCARSLERTSTTAPGDEGGPVICSDPDQPVHFAYGIYIGKVTVGDYPNPEVIANITAIRETVSKIVTPTSQGRTITTFIQANYLVTAAIHTAIILAAY